MSNENLPVRGGILSLNLPSNNKLTFALIYDCTQGGRKYVYSNEYAAIKLGISKRSIASALSQLLKKGYIEKVPESEAKIFRGIKAKYRPTQYALAEMERLEKERAEASARYWLYEKFTNI